MDTLKPQSSGPLYSNAVIGTLGCYVWYSEEGPVWAVVPPSPLLDVANVTATDKRPVYQLHIIQCGTIIACALQRVQVTESNCSVSTARMSTELLLNMRIIVFFLLLVYCNSYLQCCDTVGCHVTPRCFTPDVLPATTFPFLGSGTGSEYSGLDIR